MKHNFLNVFNEHRALQLLENGCDYADMTDNLVMIVANDGSVWVCTLDNSVNINDAKLIQRLV